MDCSAIREWLVEYREKELCGQRKVAVECHLKLCGGCRAELTKLEELVAAIARIPAVDPWPGFSRRLQSRIERRASLHLGARLGGFALTYTWIASGVLLALLAAAASWLFLKSDQLLSSKRKSEARVVAPRNDSKVLLGKTEITQIIGISEGLGFGWDDLDKWPDGMLTGLALGNLEPAPEEALTLWIKDLAGVKGLEQLVEIPGASDPQVERVLDQVRR